MKEHEKHGFEKQFLTEAQYVAKHGVQCPHCHKEEVVGFSYSSDGLGVLTQEMTCNLCDAEWTDRYKLDGYDDLELDNGES